MYVTGFLVGSLFGTVAGVASVLVQHWAGNQVRRVVPVPAGPALVRLQPPAVGPSSLN